MTYPSFPASSTRAYRRQWRVYTNTEWHGGCDDIGLRERIAAENHESKDYRVRPLAQRLTRIFQIDGAGNPALLDQVCRSFMAQIFALGTVYSDVVPTLDALRVRGYRTAIVTNTPWGSPNQLWREEIERLGLASRVDLVVCCDDVGWRKPAAPIFQYAIEKLKVDAEQCLVIGDDPRWDIVGPAGVGMRAVMIDRLGAEGTTDRAAIHSLEEVLVDLPVWSPYNDYEAASTLEAFLTREAEADKQPECQGPKT